MTGTGNLMGWGSAPSTDTGTEIPTTATTRPLDSWNNRILALELALALVLVLFQVPLPGAQSHAEKFGCYPNRPIERLVREAAVLVLAH